MILLQVWRALSIGFSHVPKRPFSFSEATIASCHSTRSETVLLRTARISSQTATWTVFEACQLLAAHFQTWISSIFHLHPMHTHSLFSLRSCTPGLHSVSPGRSLEPVEIPWSILGRHSSPTGPDLGMCPSQGVLGCIQSEQRRTYTCIPPWGLRKQTRLGKSKQTKIQVQWTLGCALLGEALRVWVMIQRVLEGFWE